VKENSIEEDIKIIENFINWLTIDFEYDSGNEIKAIEHILSAYKKVLKENECLKNHVHYKNCIACGKEFKSKRDDAKYCIKCSKQIANKNYIANLTEEQKLKRREQAKLAMRKLRANRK
jgi:hypothetical protein